MMIEGLRKCPRVGFFYDLVSSHGSSEETDLTPATRAVVPPSFALNFMHTFEMY